MRVPGADAGLRRLDDLLLGPTEVDVECFAQLEADLDRFRFRRLRPRAYDDLSRRFFDQIAVVATAAREQACVQALQQWRQENAEAPHWMLPPPSWSVPYPQSTRRALTSSDVRQVVARTVEYAPPLGFGDIAHRRILDPATVDLLQRHSELEVLPRLSEKQLQAVVKWIRLSGSNYGSTEAQRLSRVSWPIDEISADAPRLPEPVTVYRTEPVLGARGARIRRLSVGDRVVHWESGVAGTVDPEPHWMGSPGGASIECLAPPYSLEGFSSVVYEIRTDRLFYVSKRFQGATHIGIGPEVVLAPGVEYRVVGIADLELPARGRYSQRYWVIQLNATA